MGPRKVISVGKPCVLPFEEASGHDIKQQLACRPTGPWRRAQTGVSSTFRSTNMVLRSRQEIASSRNRCSSKWRWHGPVPRCH